MARSQSTTINTAGIVVQRNGPVVRRPDTGCSVTLGAGLKPASVRHAAARGRCKCVRIEAPEQLDQMAASVRNAVHMRILDSEKPSLALAVLLLGGVHVLE